jgi:hypothetical protein
VFAGMHRRAAAEAFCATKTSQPSIGLLPDLFNCPLTLDESVCRVSGARTNLPGIDSSVFGDRAVGQSCGANGDGTR